MAVSFSVTKAESKVINKIADRAVADYRRHGVTLNKMDVQMDITATHANGCPLRLDDLLAADAFNFAHDITGIARHLDRTTGSLTGHFLPRFCAALSRAD